MPALVLAKPAVLALAHTVAQSSRMVWPCSCRIGERDKYRNIFLRLSSSSQALQTGKLLNSQITSLTAIWASKDANFTQAILFGNDKQLAVRSIDENDSLVIFEWEVDYEDFKEVGGYVELMAVALTGDGRQIWSDAKVVRNHRI